VPIGILIDEQGRLVRSVGSVNINNENFRQELTKWVNTSAIPQNWVQNDKPQKPRALTPDEAKADGLFQRSIVLLEKNKKDEAIAELKRAFQLDPQNWIIRKQLWAIEHPEAFYEGNVDYAWQKKQQAQEDSEQ